MPASVNVRVRQLEAIAGVVPVALTCEGAKAAGEAIILQIACRLQNNSQAAMIAGTVHVLTTIDVSGKEEMLSSYETFDTFLHADFRDEKQSHRIEPGMVYPFDVTPVEYQDAVVKEFLIEIDYIEFVNGSSVGPDRVGSRTIGDIRKGAVKYKAWLAKQYKGSAASVRAIADLLDNEAIPAAEIGLQNADETSGANMYRKYARRMYNLKRSDEYLKHLVIP